MVVDSDYLVCVNNELLYGKLIAIYQYNVVIELYGDVESKRQAVNKENVVCSISSEALKVIKKHY